MIKINLSKKKENSFLDTKDCPNCHASIEKNGGCNHMSKSDIEF